MYHARIVPLLGLSLIAWTGALGCSSSDVERQCPPGLVPGPQGICIPGGSSPTGGVTGTGTGAEAQCNPALADTLRINELLYQHPGSDQENEFIELIGPPGANLRGYRLEAISGANDSRQVTLGINLSGTIRESGYFVTGGSAVPNLDQDFGCSRAAGCLQNNAESVVLLGCEGEVVDALGYGPFESTGRVNFGLGEPAPAATSGRSLSRCPGQPDTRDNARDFGVSDPTPGSRNAGFRDPEFCDESALSTPGRSTSALPADAPCLRFSEYIEGSSNNKAFEIQSCSEETIALDDVGVCVITNDAQTCSTTLMLREMELAPGAVTTVCNTRLNTDLLEQITACDFESNVANYNGDDRLLLFLDRGGNGRFDAGTDLVLDAFGETRVRPDSLIWSDMTLKRCRPDRFDGQSAFVASDWFVESGLEDFSTFGEPIAFEGCEADPSDDTTPTSPGTTPSDAQDTRADAARYCLRISHFLRGGTPANRNKALAIQSCADEDLPLSRVAICRLVPSATGCGTPFALADEGSNEVFEAGSVRVICHPDLAALPAEDSPLPEGVRCDHVSSGVMGYGDNARFLLFYKPEGTTGFPEDARGRGLVLDAFGQTTAPAPDGASWTGTWVRCNGDAFDGASPWDINAWFRNVAPRSANDFDPFASPAEFDDCEPANGEPSNGEPSNGEPSNGEPSNGEPSNGEPSNGEPSSQMPDPADYCLRISHFIRGGAPLNQNKALAIESCSTEDLPLEFVSVCRLNPSATGCSSRLSLADAGSSEVFAAGSVRIVCHEDLDALAPEVSPLPDGVTCDHVSNGVMNFANNARFLLYLNPDASDAFPENARARDLVLDAFGQTTVAVPPEASWTGTWVRCNPNAFDGASPWNITDWFRQVAVQADSDFSPFALPAPKDGCTPQASDSSDE